MERQRPFLPGSLEDGSDKRLSDCPKRPKVKPGLRRVLQEAESHHDREIVALPVEADPFSKEYKGTAISITVPVLPSNPVPETKTVRFDSISDESSSSEEISDSSETSSSDDQRSSADNYSDKAPGKTLVEPAVPLDMNANDEHLYLEEDDTYAFTEMKPITKKEGSKLIPESKGKVASSSVSKGSTSVPEGRDLLDQSVLQRRAVASSRPQRELKAPAPIPSFLRSLDAERAEGGNQAVESADSFCYVNDIGAKDKSLENSQKQEAPEDSTRAFSGLVNPEDLFPLSKAHSLLAESTKNVSRLQAEVRVKDEAIIDLDAQLTCLEAERIRTALEVQLLKNQLKASTSSVSAIRQEAIDNKEKNCDLEERFQTLLKKTQDLEDAIVSLEQEKLQLYKENCYMKLQEFRQNMEKSQLKAHIESLNKSIADVESERNVAVEANKISKEKLLQLGQLEKTQSTVIDELKKDLIALKSINNAVSEKNEALSLQVSNLKIEEKSMKLAVASLEKDKGESDKVIVSFKAKLRLAEDSHSLDKAKIELLTQKVLKLENERSRQQNRFSEERKMSFKSSAKELKAKVEEISCLRVKLLELECANENANARNNEISADLKKEKEEKAALQIQVSNSADAFQRLEKNMMSLEEAYEKKAQRAQQITVEKRDLQEFLNIANKQLTSKVKENLSLHEILRQREEVLKDVKREANANGAELRKSQEQFQAAQFNYQSQLRARDAKILELVSRNSELVEELEAAAASHDQSRNDLVKELEEKTSSESKAQADLSALKKRFGATLDQRGVVFEAICSRLQHCAPIEHKEIFQDVLSYPRHRHMSDRRVERLATHIKSSLKYMQEQSELQARKILILEEENREFLRRLVLRTQFSVIKKQRSPESETPS